MLQKRHAHLYGCLTVSSAVLIKLSILFTKFGYLESKYHLFAVFGVSTMNYFTNEATTVFQVQLCGLNANAKDLSIFKLE